MRIRKSKKPVKISVPIDLRKFFPSKSVRNFSSYINVPFEDDDLTLERAVEIVKGEFAKINKEFLQLNINSNVSLQENLFIKIMPIAIKNVFLSLAFNVLGEKLQTCAFSSFGVIKTPPEFAELVERYEVNLGRSKHNSIAMSAITFQNTLCLTLSSKLSENTTERDFIRFLSAQGLSIKVESNRRDEYGG